MSDWTPTVGGKAMYVTGKELTVLAVHEGHAWVEFEGDLFTVAVKHLSPVPEPVCPFPMGAKVRRKIGPGVFIVTGWKQDEFAVGRWSVRVRSVDGTVANNAIFPEHLELVPEPVADEPPAGSIVAQPSVTGVSAAYCNKRGYWRNCDGGSIIADGWPSLREQGYVVIRHGWGDEPAEVVKA